MRRVYICSPLRGNIPANIQHAQRLCHEAMQQEGIAPFAPHAFYTHFLDDDNEDERDQGIACGLAWLNACDEVWVDDRRGITQGMQAEIRIADGRHILVRTPPWKTPLPAGEETPA